MTSPAITTIASYRRPDEDPAQLLTIGAAQLGGPWLNPSARLERVIACAEAAASEGCEVVVFPESYLSGYPFWLPRTEGARFNDPAQKACYAYYLDAAIEISGPEVNQLRSVAGDLGLALVVGVTERGTGNGHGSTYCALLAVDPANGLVGHHRKLIPTYDERLVWAPGDGAGLRTHAVGRGRIGALNCWENWMPSARLAMYAGGEDVHVGIWPGSTDLTVDITRFIALEGRVFSVAVSGLLRADEVPDDFPLADELRARSSAVPFDGGSAVAGPDGRWLITPVADAEGLIVADLALGEVAQERLTFDPTGHYSRPDVFGNTVRRARSTAVNFVDDPITPRS
ncbi:carbon-nitrogen hydrolase family protein [Mycolicibacterium sp. CBM1]